MKTQLIKGAAVLSAAAAVSLLQALPASAYTIDGSKITFLSGATNETFFVEFDGRVNNNIVNGLQSVANVNLASFDGTQAIFNFQLFNTTTNGLNSRISALGFDSSPNVSSATVSGDFANVRSGNVPNLGQREICFTNANNCSGGGGTGPTAGQDITFQAILNFAQSQSSLTLDNFFVRYQDITGVQGGNSGVGVGTPIPTPALLPGLIGLGVAALRKRDGDTEDQEAA